MTEPAPSIVDVLRDMARDNAGNDKLAWLFNDAADRIETLERTLAGKGQGSPRSAPVILYFPSDAQARQFIASVRGIVPGADIRVIE